MKELSIRPLRDEDVPQVVELLGASLGEAPGGADRRSLFEWKHLRNVFGRSIALVGEADGRLVGLRAFMHWRFEGPAGERLAVRAVDTATAPGAQRTGVFSELTREALRAAEGEGVDFVFNTPNEKSLPGYLKMGWRTVTRWPVRVRARRPARFAWAMARGRREAGGPVEPGEGPARTAAAAFRDERVLGLMGELSAPRGPLATARTAAYLRWRYGEAPVPYHVHAEDEGLVVYRLRSRGPLVEAVVVETFSRPGKEGLRRAARVLREAMAAAGADHAVAHFGTGQEALGHAARFLPMPGQGMAFVARRLSDRAPDPTAASSWALTMGDLELF